MNELDIDIAANLAAVRAEIASAVAAAGREPGSVTLVAVSKTKPSPLIEAAIDAGQAIFGENRLQESEEKWPGLKQAHDGIELRCIGPLQSRKVAPAVALFDVIETIDREKTAAAAARAMAEQGRRPACLIQINTGEEPQKAGIAPVDADRFIDTCRETHGLPVQGLMCIPPAGEEPAPHFALLAKIAARNGLAQLSMGMSADFATAIQFGATHVRVGTAIFGARG